MAFSFPVFEFFVSFVCFCSKLTACQGFSCPVQTSLEQKKNQGNEVLEPITSTTDGGCLSPSAAGYSKAAEALRFSVFAFFVSFVCFCSKLTESQGLSCPMQTSLEQKKTKATKRESRA